MKINEMEAMAGITKKNIRFYESQGLLMPRRNPDNGYREYGEQELQTLCQIKLLRKLGLPIEEIRRMLDGNYTLSDGMRRHRVSLERERQNLEQSLRFCDELQEMDVPLGSLDAHAFLERMESLEKGGASFQNKQLRDVRVRYVAPVVITLLMAALMGGLAALLLWTYRTAPEEAPPLWFLMLMIGMLAAVVLGVALALGQRIREIGKGEIDDAKYY